MTADEFNRPAHGRGRGYGLATTMRSDLELPLLADDGTRFDCDACEDSGYVWDGDSEVPCDVCG